MNNFILRKEKSGYFLYDILTDSIFFSDLNTENVYCENQYEPLNRNQNTKLPNEYFLHNTGRYIDNTKYNNTFSAPETVFLEVTKKCNLRCKHCFNNSGQLAENEMTLEEIRKLIDNFAEIGVFTVKITGGEPFSRKDIFDILSYLDSKSINYIVFTNGTNISAGDMVKIKNLRCLLKIRVSIDGNRETNDAIRGTGSFDKAIETVKQFKKNSIPCEINYTITKANYMQLEDLESELATFGIKYKINIGMVKIAGRAKTEKEEYYFTPENIEDAVEKIKKQLKNSEYTKPYYLLEPIYYKLFGDSFGCPGARLTTTIKSTGEVFPCGLLSEYESFLCGNIKNTRFQDIWNGDVMDSFRKLPERTECKSCGFYLKTCTGACRGNALNYCNDICGEDINCYVYQVNFNDREINYG